MLLVTKNSVISFVHATAHLSQPTQRLTFDDSTVHVLEFDAPLTVDRSVIQEDQTQGQVIRAYTVDVQLINGTNSTQWITVAQGTSVGNKKIDIWQSGAQMINAVRLNITKAVDTPVIKAFTVHLCHRNNSSVDEEFL